MAIESIYGMVATPPKSTYEPKKGIKQVGSGSAVASYEQDDPQFQQSPVEDYVQLPERRKEQRPFPRERRQPQQHSPESPATDSTPQASADEGIGTIIDTNA